MTLLPTVNNPFLTKILNLEKNVILKNNIFLGKFLDIGRHFIFIC